MPYREILTIDKINILQAENDRLRKELESRNQMLMQAHFKNKKLSEELLLTQSQYNKVVEQNKELQKAYNDLEEIYRLG